MRKRIVVEMIVFLCLFLACGYDGQAQQIPRDQALKDNDAKIARNRSQAVHAFAVAGDTKMLAMMIDQDKTLVNSQDEKGVTPLFKAVSNDHFEAAKYLLDKGADVNIKASDLNNVTPLIAAAFCGVSGRVITLLLEHGADPYVRDNLPGSNRTPLEWAQYLINHPDKGPDGGNANWQPVIEVLEAWQKKNPSKVHQPLEQPQRPLGNEHDPLVK